MHFTSTLCQALALLTLFSPPAALAQSPVEEIGELPVTLSMEQARLLSQISVDATPGPAQITSEPRVRRRLPRPPQLLTPEEAQFKLAVQKLGVNEHRFVHCDLPNGKVRTGVITQIQEYGFLLRDGIFAEHWIPFTDLKASPRPVAAVGTRIGQGFKWAGLIAVTIPLLPFAFLFWDGC